jgi:hypothetical protein
MVISWVLMRLNGISWLFHGDLMGFNEIKWDFMVISW